MIRNKKHTYRKWSRDEIQVLVTMFFNNSFSIGDDERNECKHISRTFNRSPSAVDRQWRNIADVCKNDKEDLRITRLIYECIDDYLEDPSAFKKLSIIVCRQNGWDLFKYIDF